MSPPEVPSTDASGLTLVDPTDYLASPRTLTDDTTHFDPPGAGPFYAVPKGTAYGIGPVNSSEADVKFGRYTDDVRGFTNQLVWFIAWYHALRVEPEVSSSSGSATEQPEYVDNYIIVDAQTGQVLAHVVAPAAN